MSGARGTVRVWCLLVAVTVISGVTPVAAGLATKELPPLTLALIRFGVAGWLLRATARLARLPIRFDASDRRRLLLLGAICVPINQAAFLFGVRLANASHAGIAYAVVPVLVYWLTRVLGTARPAARMALATVLAAVGAVATSYTTHRGSQDATIAVQGALQHLLLGDALLLVAALSWSMLIVLSQDLVRRAGAIPTLSTVFLLGAAMQLPLAIVDAACLEAARFTWRNVTWSGIGGFAFITLVTAYLSYLLFYLVIARYDVTRASIVTNMSFLIAVVVDAYVSGGSLSAWVAAGSILLILGIVLAREGTREAGPD